MTTLRISHESEQELDRKLIAIMQKRGYHVTPMHPERIQVCQLAKMVKRPLSTVSRSLHRGSCPPFEHARGKARILWLVTNPQLLAWLRP